MNTHNLFFYIHYCNCRKFNGAAGYSKKISKTIPHHEIAFFTGEKGSITAEKKRYPVKGGMLFYICPNVTHTIEIDAAEPESFLSVHFSYAQVNLDDNQWEIRAAAENLPLHTVQELKDGYQIQAVFKELVDGWNAKLPGYELVAEALLRQLIFAIFQNIKQQNRNNYAISLKIEKIIQYMQQKINHPVTLAELAALVQLSPAYLSRAFKDATGYSVIAFFNKMKIDKAKELMSEGNQKVKEAAQALGFTDEFYFSRTFKKIAGISPSEYYRQNVHGV